MSAQGLGKDTQKAEYWLIFDDVIAKELDAQGVGICHVSSLVTLTLGESLKIHAPFVRQFRSVELLATSLSACLPDLVESFSHISSSGISNRASSSVYAIGPLINRIVSTEGGLAVSNKMEVLDKHGSPIKGLYAAGTVGLGGLELPKFGYHLGWSFVSGREAGKWVGEGRTEDRS